MIVKGFEIDVDIMGELEIYLDKLDKYKQRGEKLLSCSPFRYEQTPSFAVNIETGVFIDSGATDEAWRKGNFIKLLSFFREETYQDTEDYLFEQHSFYLQHTELLQLQMNLSIEKPVPRIFTTDDLKPYCFRHHYLSGRGISEKVQDAFKIGFDKVHNAVVFPIFDKKGQIVNFKFRSVKDKVFWYKEDGQPVKQHIYGLHWIKRKQVKKVFCTEAEIDALYLWTHGFPSIAFCGASMSKKQKELLLASGVETIVIATDNDKVGRRFKGTLINKLGGLFNVEEITFPTEQVKDVNEMTPEVLKVICENPVAVRLVRF